MNQGWNDVEHILSVLGLMEYQGLIQKELVDLEMLGTMKRDSTELEMKGVPSTIAMLVLDAYTYPQKYLTYRMCCNQTEIGKWRQLETVSCTSMKRARKFREVLCGDEEMYRSTRLLLFAGTDLSVAIGLNDSDTCENFDFWPSDVLLSRSFRFNTMVLSYMHCKSFKVHVHCDFQKFFKLRISDSSVRSDQEVMDEWCNLLADDAHAASRVAACILNIKAEEDKIDLFSWAVATACSDIVGDVVPTILGFLTEMPFHSIDTHSFLPSMDCLPGCFKRPRRKGRVMRRNQYKPRCGANVHHGWPCVPAMRITFECGMEIIYPSESGRFPVQLEED